MFHRRLGSVSELGKPLGHAFISYAHDDSPKADWLHQELEAAGVPVWRDTADLWPGEDWRAKIRQAITEEALVFIACFSSRSVARPKSYQNEELAVAVEQLRQRPVGLPWLIPTRFEDCKIPDIEISAGRMLSSIQRVDVFGECAAEGTARLVSAVLKILESHRDYPARPGTRPTSGGLNAPRGPGGPEVPSSAESPQRLADASSRPSIPPRLASLIRQRLLTEKQPRNFQVASPDRRATEPLRRAALLHQLEPGEEIIATWMQTRRVFFRNTTKCLIFTTAGIRINDEGRIRLYISYSHMSEYRFEHHERTEYLRNERVNGGSARKYTHFWLTAEGLGNAWSSYASYDDSPIVLANHLNAIKKACQ